MMKRKERRHAVNIWNLDRGRGRCGWSGNVTWNPSEEGGRDFDLLRRGPSDNRSCGAGDQLGDVIDKNANNTIPEVTPLV